MITQIGQQGWSQQTPAAVQIIRSGMGAATRVGRTIRRVKKKLSGLKKKSKKKRAKSAKPARLVKGSAAAKAYMKKIRAKRG